MNKTIEEVAAQITSVTQGIGEIKGLVEGHKTQGLEHSNRIKAIEDAFASINKNLTDFKKRGAFMTSTQRQRRGLGSDDMNKAFGAAMVKLLKGQYSDEVFTKALSDASGGNIVNPEFHAELIRLVEERGIIRKISRHIPCGTGTNNWPRRTGGITGYHTAKNTAGTESDATIGQVQLLVDTIMAISRVPNQSLEDELIDLGAFISEEIAYGFATVEDNDAINGDGTATFGSINGLLNAALYLTTNAPAVITLAAKKTAFSDVAFDDLMDVTDQVKSGALSGARWIMHRSLRTVLRQIKDKQGRYIWEPATAAGAPEMILGYPVSVSDQMPARSTSAAAKKFLLFGNFDYWYFGDRREVKIIADGSRYRELNQTGFFGDERIAQAIADGGAFAALQTSDA